MEVSMSEKERTETWRDDSVPLDKEVSSDGLITESHEPESKDAYRHGYHYHREHSEQEEHSHHHSGDGEHRHSERSHHHGEHRHHRRHHRHHRRSRSHPKNKYRKSLKQIFIKNKKRILYTALAVLFFTFAVFAGVYFDRIVGEVSKQSTTGTTQNADGKLLVSVSVFDKDVSLAGSAVQAYLTDDTGATVHDIFTRYKGKEYRLDIGSPVTLNYEIKGCPQGYAVQSTEFVVSENADFSNATTITVEGNTKEAVFYNLKTGTQYEYRINIHFTNDVVSTVGGQFRTAIGPRMMKVDGAYNMRDIGGWITTDGQMVRQGLLYRGCELDGAVVDRYTITKAGIDTLINDLGIKTDMDLRSALENPHNIDVLGGNVKHTYYGVQMYNAIFEKGKDQAIRSVFKDLANKNNYPVYIHCTYGQDRTGTICYLLNALLGVPQESLLQDYELSGLHHGYVETVKMSEFMDRVNQLPGSTLSEKVEGYLLTIGVTEQEISNIRNIFLDK